MTNQFRLFMLQKEKDMSVNVTTLYAEESKKETEILTTK